jgi:predicted  nucleic acid-binding Zn-ribbon protein
MKNVVPIFLGILLVILVVALFVIKSNDNTQITGLNASLDDCSNRLDIVNARVTERDAQLVMLSNNLVTASAAVMDVSNQLAGAQSTIEEQKQQVNKLNGQLADANTQNDTLNRSLTDATNQITALSQLQTATKASLEQTNAALVQMQGDYSVLGQRLQEDVAARLVLERRWRSPQALLEQQDYLKYSPEEIVTPERIYAGLNVLVSSNGSVRVLSPD